MPSIASSPARVVDTGKLVIDELVGNVATNNDNISIAHVRISEPTCEPWLTLHYDEWMCILKGRMVLNYGEGKTLEVLTGQTVFIEKGERFQPTFPDGDTEYIPVCLPAFRPDRCIREDEPNSDVSLKLRALHTTDGDSSKKAKLSQDEVEPEILYHMCQRSLWDEAKASGEAYFPPTFDSDAFTHATAVPARLITTANHFYQDVPGEWICLRFRRSALKRLGIVTRDEEAMAVGQKGVSQEFSSWVCPHVIGGIPPQVVDKEFAMMREGAAYTVIDGLTNVPQRVFKLATAAEASEFRKMNKICSELDNKDGFIHLSDHTSVPVVAKHFFSKCADLRLLEIDVAKLSGPVNWLIGAMGDAEPGANAKASAPTVVHYLKKNGCVHVYGDAVSLNTVVREVTLPLGANGMHQFPSWLEGALN